MNFFRSEEHLRRWVGYEEKKEGGKMMSWLWGNHEYKIGVKQPHVELKPDVDVVNEGYHSFIHSSGKRYRVYLQGTFFPIEVECIIPKGSQYMVNKDKNNYVSTSIIIKKVVR